MTKYTSSYIPATVLPASASYAFRTVEKEWSHEMLRERCVLEISDAG